MPVRSHDLHGSAPDKSAAAENEHALAQIENVLNADVTIAEELDLKALTS